MDKPHPGERRWLRAAALLGAAIVLSGQPLVLVILPLALMTVLMPDRRGFGLVAAALLLALVMVGSPKTGSWYLERGWALLVGGCFVALTLRWPGWGFVPRALGAVGGAFAASALFFLVRPESWTVADWVMNDRIRTGVGAALEAMRILQGDAALSPAVVGAVLRAAEIQGMIFPALLGLSSVAGLGVAWWLYVRFVHGSDRALGPLRDFHFNDQLIWILILGLAAAVFRLGEGWNRLGTNAVVFVGTLYAVRGAAVVTFLAGGVSLLGFVLVLLGLLFLAPVVVAGALIIGLGDTWLDLRERARAILG
jgi:hypothetical protein